MRVGASRTAPEPRNLSSTEPHSPRLRNPNQLRRGERYPLHPSPKWGQSWTPIEGQSSTPIDSSSPFDGSLRPDEPPSPVLSLVEGLNSKDRQGAASAGFRHRQDQPRSTSRRPALRPGPRSPPPERHDWLDGSRNAGAMLTVVGLILYNTYDILILLDRAPRASHTDSIAPSIVRSNGPPRSDLPQFRHRFPVRARCA